MAHRLVYTLRIHPHPSSPQKSTIMYIVRHNTNQTGTYITFSISKREINRVKRMKRGRRVKQLCRARNAGLKTRQNKTDTVNNNKATTRHKCCTPGNPAACLRYNRNTQENKNSCGGEYRSGRSPHECTQSGTRRVSGTDTPRQARGGGNARKHASASQQTRHPTLSCITAHNLSTRYGAAAPNQTSATPRQKHTP